MMMTKTSIQTLFNNKETNQNLVVQIGGWVKKHRSSSKKLTFLHINDGSCFESLQVVVQITKENTAEESSTLSSVLYHKGSLVGTSIVVEGAFRECPKKNNKIQSFELHASKIIHLGVMNQDLYPIAKSELPFDFLRTYAHLRHRTTTFHALANIKNTVLMETHNFFQQQQYLFTNLPQLTTNDCEGAGETFEVLAQDASFFGKPVHLTVSAQLHLEALCHGLGKVYCLQSAFRADKSNTYRHACEFMMLEVETAFQPLDEMMDMCEQYIKHIFRQVVTKHPKEINFLDEKQIELLNKSINTPFQRITYSDAIELLIKQHQSCPFTIEPFWGLDLNSEHERFIAEVVYNKPVFLTHFPREIKSFYMMPQKNNHLVVDSCDLILPGVGECLGGSTRNNSYDDLMILTQEMKQDSLQWYLDLRRFGSAVTSGFGVGIERLLMFVTGIHNIRDIQYFPRNNGTISY